MSKGTREVKEMAAAVAAAMGLQTGKRKKHLMLVDDVAQGSMNALQRDVIYSRVRDLASQYRLEWLVRQETMHVMGIMECLSDDELNTLLRTVDRGVEAVMDGVAFAEVGLVKGATCNWVA